MIANFNHLSNWRNRFYRRKAAPPLTRPNLAQLAKPGTELPQFVTNSDLAQRYLTLLGALDWDHFPERNPSLPCPGLAPNRCPEPLLWLLI